MVIGITYGVFDILHHGHIKLLNEAQELCDRLIVGVFSDEVAENFKRKPIMSEDERIEILEELGYETYLLDSEDPEWLVYILEHEEKTIEKDDIVLVIKSTGAGFEDLAHKRPNYILLPYHEGISTSEIIERIKKCK
jgi:glycerol-3-phosphate cytidylyltransferase